MFRSLFLTAAVLGLSASTAFAQINAAQNPQNNQNAGRNNATQNQSPSGYGAIGQQPWFTNPGISQQLKLNEDQTNRLNKAWSENWTRYQTQTGKLSDLPQAEQGQRRAEYMQSFNQGFGTASKDIFTPEQQRRYDQLRYQYMGSGVFSDPALQQQLNLTEEQKTKLREHQQQMYGANSTASGQWRQRDQQWLNSFLTEQQRNTWRQMTGDPYDFSTTSKNSTNNQNRNP